MENIKLSEVKRLLIDGLQPLANKHGYKLNKGKFAFIKREQNRTSRLYFTENHWSDEVQIIPAIDVSIKEVDDIIKNFDGIAVNFYDSSLQINLNKLAYWYGNKSLDDFEYDDKDKYIIQNYTNDINNAVNGISENFEKYGLRYIDEYGNIEGLNKLYNSNLVEEYFSNFSFIEQIIFGLILSKIVDLNHEQIAEIYTQRVNKKKDDMSKEHFELFFKIKKHLR